MKKAKATQKVKSLIALGKTNKEIMKAVPKETLQQLYNHRYLMKKREASEISMRVEVTPQEDEAMNKIANDTQVGGVHYKEKELQVWDAITAWGCGFLDGNVIEYVVGYRSKGGVEDLKKARHYLDKLIEVMEKQ